MGNVNLAYKLRQFFIDGAARAVSAETPPVFLLELSLEHRNQVFGLW